MRVGLYRAQKLALVAYGDGNHLLGGMFGWLQWDWLFIDWAWVAQNERRRGIGTALLQRFEASAQNRGVHRARLNTASFQEGLNFYRRNGYEVFAELEIKAPNGDEHMDFLLRKTSLCGSSLARNDRFYQAVRRNDYHALTIFVSSR